MIADWLLLAICVQQLKGVWAYLFSVVEAIISHSGWRAINVCPILVGHRLGEFLINQVLIDALAWRLAAQCGLGIFGRLVQSFIHFCWITDAALIVCLPVLSAGLEEVEAISVCSLASFFCFQLIVCFRKWISCEVEGWVATPLNVFRMIILWFCVFEVGLFIDGMVVIIVVKGVDPICFALGWWPDLVFQLQVLALFDGRVGLFRVALVASVPNYFVYHWKLYNYYSYFYI